MLPSIFYPLPIFSRVLLSTHMTKHTGTMREREREREITHAACNIGQKDVLYGHSQFVFICNAIKPTLPVFLLPVPRPGNGGGLRQVG